jgi:hypothetical protein
VTDVLPPPFPFSPESSLRVDATGVFWHEGQKFEHAGLAQAFAGWIAVEPETGRYILKNDISWCYLAVDDAPLVVRGVREGEGGELHLSLSDGTTEVLDLATLRVDEDDVPYCDVRGGRLPARFLRPAAFALLCRVRPSGEGHHLLSVGERDVPLVRVPRGEGAGRPQRF